MHSNKPRKPKTRDQPELPIENATPTQIAFTGYAKELDERNDRHERIVKISRDITIEAKRVIFLLHTIEARKDNKAKVLKEANERLNKLIAVNFKKIAEELIDQNVYQHRSAYSPGLQEFIEAYCYMEYMKNAKDTPDAPDAPNEEIQENVEPTQMSSWKELQKRMQYEQQQPENKTDDTKTITETNVGETSIRTFEFFVDPTEYILGVSDLGGEIMRRCINSLGSGEVDSCFETCKVLQQLYAGFISLNVQRCRELSRKIYTMRQSVLKTENVCYNVKVRGGEAAKWGAVYDNKPNDYVDEGFF